jgi:hypothetical protein
MSARSGGKVIPGIRIFPCSIPYSLELLQGTIGGKVGAAA